MNGAFVLCLVLCIIAAAMIRPAQNHDRNQK